jgi:hypothetical protein
MRNGKFFTIEPPWAHFSMKNFAELIHRKKLTLHATFENSPKVCWGMCWFLFPKVSHDFAMFHWGQKSLAIPDK